MKIETVLINTIKPYFRNPRLNDKTVKALVKSIKRYGFNVPVVVDRNSVIITGHARYKALLELGSSTVDIVRATDLTPEEARQYRITDNKTQEISLWEDDILNDEIKSMNSWRDLLDDFDGTLDDVLDGIGDIDDLELELDTEEPDEQPELTHEEIEQQRKPLGQYNDSPNFVMCPYCGEYNSKEELIKSIKD